MIKPDTLLKVGWNILVDYHGEYRMGKIIDAAGGYGDPTVIFIDEIHLENPLSYIIFRDMIVGIETIFTNLHTQDSGTPDILPLPFDEGA
jgi:hypothetical protein